MSVQIEGMPRLRAALARVDAEGVKTVQREVMRATLNIHAGAKKRCPVDTGRLRNSIAFRIEEGGFAGVVGTNVHYAPHVEFGTRRMRARPYLLPALEEERPKFYQRLRAAFGGPAVRSVD